MLDVRDVRWAYGNESAAIAGVSLTVRAGERVALLGANGSGKSTLASLMCGGLVPDSGAVLVDGASTAERAGRMQARRLVGRVAQRPTDQLISTIVFDEVAFGPQNLGLDEEDVRARVREALADVGLAGFETREVNALSGGEQQRLAIAGVLAMRPRYFVLDEATAMVDSAERPQLRELTTRLAREAGIGVVTITHDPLEALASDCIYVLEAGALVWTGAPDAFVLQAPQRMQATLLQTPYARGLAAAAAQGYRLSDGVEPADLAAWCATAPPAARDGVRTALRGCERADQRPQTPALAREGAQEAREACEVPRGACGGEDGAAGPPDLAEPPGRSGEPVLIARGVSAGYRDEPVISEVNLELRAGEVLLMAGPSGAGKSTLACALAGLVEPIAGTVSLAGAAPRPGEVALAFQDPEHQFFLSTVREELAFAPANAQVDPDRVAAAVEDAAHAVGIPDELMERDPFSLSGGQARRVALASVLTTGPRAVILDEPTSGLDASSRTRLHGMVQALAQRGVAVMVISHDLEEWLEVADRAALLQTGSVVWVGTVEALRACPEAFSAAGIEPPESWQLDAALSGVDGAHAGDGARVGADTSGPKADATRASRPAPARDSAETSNVLCDLDARVKLVVLFISVIAVFATEGPLLIAWFALLLAAFRAAGMGVGRLARALRPACVLLAFIVAANLISCDGSAAVVIAGSVGLNAAGAARALTAIARIVIMIGASLVVTETTTPPQVAQACVTLGRPLRAVRVPVDEIGLVLSLALRFIPVVAEEMGRVRLSQEARGVSFTEGPLIRRVRVWVSVLTPAVVGLFRRADRLAAAMDARCYEEGARRPLAPRPLAARDRVVLATATALMVAIAALSRIIF